MANIQYTSFQTEKKKNTLNAMHSRHHFLTYLQYYIFTYQYIFYLYNYKIIPNYRIVVPLNSLKHFIAFTCLYPLKGNYYLPKSNESECHSESMWKIMEKNRFRQNLYINFK